VKIRQNLVQAFLLCAVLLMLPAVAQAQFTFTTNNGAITITGYTGPGGAVTIPSTTNGMSVTSIGNSAFNQCNSLTSVTIPDSVTSIGAGAVL
jgi:BspA type Leucine rich repeat region (6 copies)